MGSTVVGGNNRRDDNVDLDSQVPIATRVPIKHQSNTPVMATAGGLLLGGAALVAVPVFYGLLGGNGEDGAVASAQDDSQVTQVVTPETVTITQTPLEEDDTESTLTTGEPSASASTSALKTTSEASADTKPSESDAPAVEEDDAREEVLPQDGNPSAPSPATSERVSAPAPGDAHVVAKGDTLGQISRTYGVSVDDLAKANGIANPDLIYPGQTIVIPQNTGVVEGGTGVGEVSHDPTNGRGIAARTGVDAKGVVTHQASTYFGLDLEV